nr:TonB-dependent receptor [Fibrella sp. ES10-3-2-2]
MSMVKQLLVSCLLLLTSHVWAQDLPPIRIKRVPQQRNITVSGRITDAKNAENLPFAYVRVRNTKLIAQTNVDGFFTLLNVPSDTCTLEISYIGFKDAIVALTPGESARRLVIELEQTRTDLDEIQVSGQKAEVMRAAETIGMVQLTPRNLTKLPNVGERDPFRALQLMPGVSAANESSAGLYVRGGTPDQTLVLLDGFTVYQVDHLYGFFSAFNYNALKDIQLQKGGFGAKYGGRLSGVAEMTGKEGSRKGFNVGGDASLLSVNAFVEGPIGTKVTVMLAGRRSFKGPLYTKLFDQFQTTQSTQPQVPAGRGRLNQLTTTQTVASYFYDLNGRVTYRPTDQDQVTLSVYNGQDYLDNSQNITLPAFNRGPNSTTAAIGGSLSNTDLSNWGNTGSSLKWSRRWSDKVYTNTLVSYSNYYSYRNISNQVSIQRGPTTRNNANFGTLEDNNLVDQSAKTDLTWQPSASQEVEAGLQYSRLAIDYAYKQNDTLTVLGKNDRGQLFTAYVQDRIRLLGNKLILTPGIRLTQYGVTGKVYAEPRLAAVYQASQQVRLKAAVGEYYQFIKQVTREDISQGNRTFWLLSGTESLPVASAMHYIAGASYETAGYLFDVEAYAKDLSGVTEYTLRFAPQVGRGLVPRETFFNGTGTVRGVDVLVQKKFGAYTGWVGYTYAMAKSNIAAFGDQPYYANQDVRNEFKSINTLHYKRFDVAATFIYAGGKPYTSIVGEYSVKLLDGTSKTFTTPSGKNANRFPDYHRLDLSATYTFKQGSIGLSMFNVYDRKNVWYKKFTSVSDGSNSQLVVTDVTYLGITPNLTLSYRLR